MKITNSEPSALKWAKIPYLISAIESNGRTLGLMILAISKKRFAVLAVEAPSRITSAQMVLDDHAHAVIGEKYRSLKAAKQAASKFGRKWAKSVKPFGQCYCPEIGVAVACVSSNDKFLN